MPSWPTFAPSGGCRRGTVEAYARDLVEYLRGLRSRFGSGRCTAIRPEHVAPHLGSLGAARPVVAEPGPAPGGGADVPPLPRRRSGTRGGRPHRAGGDAPAGSDCPGLPRPGRGGGAARSAPRDHRRRAARPGDARGALRHRAQGQRAGLAHHQLHPPRRRLPGRPREGEQGRAWSRSGAGPSRLARPGLGGGRAALLKGRSLRGAVRRPAGQGAHPAGCEAPPPPRAGRWHPQTAQPPQAAWHSFRHPPGRAWGGPPLGAGDAPATPTWPRLQIYTHLDGRRLRAVYDRAHPRSRANGER